MSNDVVLHPTDQALRDFSLGKLGDEAADSVNSHLEECSECQQRVAGMSSDSFLSRLRNARGQHDESPPLMSDATTRRPTVGDPSRPKVQTDTLPPDLADHPDYQILRELGRGGMGVVYLAHNRLMGRDEVLKVVSKHLIERKGVLERFTREIRSAARLMHPNIVHAYSAFRLGESVVFAMEYVEGLDLAKLVKAKGVLPVVNACNYAYQAALGLQHAHEQGMVHRDIKPGNLMLSRKGEKAIVKVLDFGLAKATRESPIDGGLTHEGQMLGTPDFIAPEQIRDAQSAGIQADIYSLGCTLYYLLSGAPPFEATSLYDLLQAHFSTDAQPLNLVRPDVPAELAALVAKMMAKEPGRRFQSPAQVAEALKPFIKRAATTTKPEVSALGESGLPPERIHAIPATTETDTEPNRLTTRPAESHGTSSVSPSLTHGEPPEPDRSGDVLAPARVLAPGRRPPRNSSSILLAACASGLVLLGIIIVIITKNSRVTIDTETGNTVISINKKKSTSTGNEGVDVGNPDAIDRRENEAVGPAAKGVASVPNRTATIMDGVWVVKQDELIGKNGVVLLGDASWSNYDMNFKARIGTGDRFRAIFHYTSPGDYCILEVGDASGQEVSVQVYQNGQRRHLTEVEKEIPTVGGVWYDVRIEVRGPAHKFYRDDSLLFTYFDEEFTKGRVGFSVISTVHFKDIVITAPDGTRYWNGLPDRLVDAQGKVTWREREIGLARLHSTEARPARQPSEGRAVVSPTEGLASGSAGVRYDVAAKRPPTSGVKPAPVSTNLIGMKLALIPSGEFLMGSPDPNAPPNEKPEHKVRITTPFFVGVTEVTQAQYEAVTGNNPSYFSPKGEGRDKVAGKPHGDYPVEQVSWFDAALFCNGLSKKEGLAPYYRLNGEEVIVPDPRGRGYRLPTEAEWEFACRGGKSGVYSPGPEPLVEYGWFRANSEGSTHPVGKKRPNEFGLFDMAANVWEWCSDEYSAEYYKHSPELDPMGPSGMSTRVRRGGSGWRSPQRASWWSNRGGVVPTDKSLVCGFRVARTQIATQDTEKLRVPTAKAEADSVSATAIKDTPIPRPSSTIASTPMIKPVPSSTRQTPAPPVAKGSPEELLRSRGLTRTGAYFVLPSEVDVLEQAKSIRSLIDQMARAFELYALVLQSQMQLADAEAFRILRSNQLDASNKDLSTMPSGPKASSLQNDLYQGARAFRDGLERERDAAARTVELLRSQQVPPERKAELAKDFAAKRSDFLKAEGELRPIYDKAMTEYRKLHADPTVKEALDAFKRSTKAAAFLGPSREFQRAIDAIKAAERAYSPETAAPKKKRKPSKP